MRDLTSKLIPGLLTLIIGAFLGTYVKSWQDKQPTQLRYLDVGTESYSLISRPSISGQKLEILLNNKPIGNLNQVLVTVYNRTDQNYEKVPIYVELVPQDGNSLQVIGEETAAANKVAQSISRIANVLPSKINGAVRIGYVIETANRSDEEPVFLAKYLVAGKISPKTEIMVEKKGLKARPLSLSLPQKTKGWQSDLIIAAAVIMGCATVMILLVKLANKLKFRKQQEIKKVLIEKFSKKMEEEDVKFEPESIAHTIVNTVLKLQEISHWERTPKLVRGLLRIKQPVFESTPWPNNRPRD